MYWEAKRRGMRSDEMRRGVKRSEAKHVVGTRCEEEAKEKRGSGDDGACIEYIMRRGRRSVSIV